MPNASTFLRGWTPIGAGWATSGTREVSPGVTERHTAWRPQLDPDFPTSNLQSARQRVVGLFDLIGETYNNLVQRGREADAFALREAAERFGRVGSKLGVNAWERTQALTDLKNRMNAAAQLREAGIQARRLATEASNIDRLTNVDRAAFGQGMQRFRMIAAPSRGARVAPRTTQSFTPQTGSTTPPARRPAGVSSGRTGAWGGSQQVDPYAMTDRAARSSDLRRRVRERAQGPQIIPAQRRIGTGIWF